MAAVKRLYLVRTVLRDIGQGEGGGSGTSQELLQLGPVKSHDGFPVDQRDRRAHIAKLLQIGERSAIGRNIAVNEVNVSL